MSDKKYLDKRKNLERDQEEGEIQSTSKCK